MTTISYRGIEINKLKPILSATSRLTVILALIDCHLMTVIIDHLIINSLGLVRLTVALYGLGVIENNNSIPFTCSYCN